MKFRTTEWFVKVVMIAAAVSMSSKEAAGQRDLLRGFEHLFTPPRTYIAGYAGDSINIDGKAIENYWSTAPWTDFFSDIEGELKPEPVLSTRVKMLWSEKDLYIYAELEEPHIWANITRDDEVVFYDNDFEVFLDPDGDAQHYFEVEVNARNTIFDLFLARPYRDGGSALISWNSSGLRSAIWIDGTINDPRDRDRKWCVEMAIPFRDVSLGNHVRIPKAGDHWRVNFSRVQWDVVIEKNDYAKKVDPVTKKTLPEHNWVWSPQGVVNMHYPERWGYVFFSKGAAEEDSMQIPADHEIRNHLWLAYYKQQQTRRAEGNYAPDLAGLSMRDEVVINGRSFEASCQCHDSRFLFILRQRESATTWTIDEKGIIQRKDIKR